MGEEIIGVEINSLEYWEKKPVEEIAIDFGYVSNPNFSEALEEFKLGRLEKGMIEDFLRPLAIGYFGNWKPPLEIRNKK